MTRAEYLRELQSGLEGRVSAEEIGDILNEYTGFFDAGGEEGRTEEETAAALGSPAALARMLTEGREAVQPAPVGTIPGNPAPRSLFSGPPLASFGRRFAALLLDRIFVFLLLVLILAAGFLLASKSGTAPEANASTTGWQEHLADDANTRVEVAVIAVVPLVFIIGLLFPQLAAPVILLMAGRMYSETKNMGSLIPLLLGMALLLLYKPVLEALWNGRTVGKRLMSIQVTAQDGGRASAGKIFLRELVGDTLLGGITGGITSVVSIFTVAIGREHKSVPDYIAATLVIVIPKKDRRVRLNGEGSAWTPN